MSWTSLDGQLVFALATRNEAPPGSRVSVPESAGFQAGLLGQHDAPPRLSSVLAALPVVALLPALLWGGQPAAAVHGACGIQGGWAVDDSGSAALPKPAFAAYQGQQPTIRTLLTRRHGLSGGTKCSREDMTRG